VITCLRYVRTDPSALRLSSVHSGYDAWQFSIAAFAIVTNHVSASPPFGQHGEHLRADQRPHGVDQEGSDARQPPCADPAELVISEEKVNAEDRVCGSSDPAGDGHRRQTRGKGRVPTHLGCRAGVL
jgi:hypothetical protein